MQLVETREQIRPPMPAPRRTTNRSTLNNSLVKSTPKRRPIPKPRRSVKELVQQYEDDVIPPPIQFRDKPTPAPRSKVKKLVQTLEPLRKFRDRPVPAPRTKKQKPVAAKRTLISQTEKALKGYTKSYEIEVRDEMDPLKQLNMTKRGVEYELKNNWNNSNVINLY